jgi:beta-lactam-binding protein with PASTA domain
MKWLNIPLYALAACAVFILAASFTVKFLVTDESTVVCPDLTGLEVGEAKQLAAQKGLSLIIGKYETKKDVPYNRVLFQTPDPAMPVRTGRIVTVVLSDGPVPVIIPAFVGLSLEEAQAALADKGMKFKKVIYVPGGAANRVVAQIPGSGENILNEEGMVLFVGGRCKGFYVMPEIAAGSYAGMLQEMDQKHIRYTMTSAGLPDAAGGRALKCNIPSRTIFTEDDVLELQTGSGG